MRISNIEISASEESALRILARRNGFDPESLSPPNLIRAALGFPIRRQGGARPGGFEPGNNLSPRHPRAKKKTRRLG